MRIISNNRNVPIASFDELRESHKRLVNRYYERPYEFVGFIYHNKPYCLADFDALYDVDGYDLVSRDGNGIVVKFVDDYYDIVHVGVLVDE